MNITKYLILILFLLAPISISSQEQQENYNAFIDSADVQKGSLDEGGRIVKNDLIYSCSNEPCEGFRTDYYDDEENKIRMTGYFKEGMPIDTIKEYYENGILKSMYYPYKRKYKHCGRKYNYCLYIEYDDQGNCTRYTNDKKGIERKYRSDGALISVMYYCRRKSRVKYHVQNYPGRRMKSVITKGHRYDYDDNERLRRHWVRKSAKYDKEAEALSVAFYFEEYDVMGNVSKIGRLYSNLYEHDQWLHVFPEFPAAMDSVPAQDFKEITYPRLNLKDVYRWDFLNNKTIIERYELQGAIWVEIERKSLPRQ